MRQAELTVGNEYAFTEGRWDQAAEAARVRLNSIEGRGQISVTVVDPGRQSAYWRRKLKKKEQVSLSTRELLCAWPEYPAIQAEAQAKVDERAERDRVRGQRVVIDPTRPLPAGYEAEFDETNTYNREWDALRAAEAATNRQRLDDYAVGLSDFYRGELPLTVIRDLIAAVNIHGNPTSTEPGSVGQVLKRAGQWGFWLLLQLDNHDSGHSLSVDELGEPAGDFIEAVQQSYRDEEGAELLLPTVPAMPAWIEEPGAYDRVRGEGWAWRKFGWLRVAYGDSPQGRFLHSPDCKSLTRGGMGDGLATDSHMPVWQMIVFPRRHCGRCEGPTIRDLSTLVPFLMALDIWQARDRSGIEAWQRAAVTRFIESSESARAQIEPHRTLAYRIVDTMSADLPGEEGWPAYRIVGSWIGDTDIAGVERRSAVNLAIARLNLLNSLLPTKLRLIALPTTADTETTRQRYRHFNHLITNDLELDLPVERLVFGLPGASRHRDW